MQPRTTFIRQIFILSLVLLHLFATPLGAKPATKPVTKNANASEEVYRQLETFSNVLAILQDNYVEEVDTDSVIQGAIKGMLSSLDPHSAYMKPDDFKELQVETKGSFTGIGIEITTRNNVLVVVSPIEGTPAYAAGLKAGDKILKINNEPTKDMSLMEAVKKLRGPKGSKITITIHREGWPEMKDFAIAREVIPIHSVKARLIEPGYITLRVTNFQASTTEEIVKAMAEVTGKDKPMGLILDIRNNPGGLLDQAVKVADLFLDEGIIVSTRGRLQDQNSTYSAHSHGTSYHYPMVVLVNEGSASASEIVAGAIQDHKRGLVVGTQTFGKGSVQTIIPMSNGAGLRLTTARYYTPNGRSIQATGIAPDIIVQAKTAREDEGEGEARPSSITREKDLRHHIKNGNMPPAETPETLSSEEEEKKEDGTIGGDDKKKRQKELERDNQLNTALLILKGLNVFTDLGK